MIRAVAQGKADAAWARRVDVPPPKNGRREVEVSVSCRGSLWVVAAQVGGEEAIERAVGQERPQAHEQGGIPAGPGRRGI